MKSVITTTGHKNLAIAFYNMMLSQIKASNLFIAYGEGRVTSELNINNITSLINETYRAPVLEGDLVYLKTIGGTSDTDVISDIPTQFIRLNASLTEPGMYTEWGLLTNATSEGGGNLIVYQYVEPNESSVNAGFLTVFDKYIYIQL